MPKIPAFYECSSGKLLGKPMGVFEHHKFIRSQSTNNRIKLVLVTAPGNSTHPSSGPSGGVWIDAIITELMLMNTQ